MAEKLVRLSMSIEKPLFDKFEELVKARGYGNRSEFVRDMVRDALVQDRWAGRKEVIGTVTLVYDHHRTDTGEKLTELQHKTRKMVLAATHIHLSDEICAEMIMLRGAPKAICELVDAMRSQKGVFHAALNMSPSDEGLD
jgi:CopG family nickel-responsive transcriptional regulator